MSDPYLYNTPPASVSFLYYKEVNTGEFFLLVIFWPDHYHIILYNASVWKDFKGPSSKKRDPVMAGLKTYPTYSLKST